MPSRPASWRWSKLPRENERAHTGEAHRPTGTEVRRTAAFPWFRVCHGAGGEHSRQRCRLLPFAPHRSPLLLPVTTVPKYLSDRVSSVRRRGRMRGMAFRTPTGTNTSVARFGPTSIHEEASVKTGARRSRDYPDIHSASSADAERHEIMRLLPFTPAASQCAMSDLGIQPESRSRSRRGGSSPDCACVSWTGVPVRT
jgi:hypothetical protein